MLRPKKKITKRELKQDALVTTYAELTSFYEKHKKNISLAVTVVVVIIIAGVVYFKNRADNNEKALTQLGAVMQYFDNGQYQLAIDGAPERNVPGLKSIVENYGNSHGGDIARFYLASAYYQVGNYDEALKAFEDCSPGDELLVTSRLSGIGASYEAKGMHRDAAEWFEKAATKHSKDVDAAENLNNAARNYAQAGEKEHALELYRRLKKQYPTTTYGRDADRLIAELSV
jgi:tetratricopeptide (TPR) repeat protein